MEEEGVDSEDVSGVAGVPLPVWSVSALLISKTAL